MTLILSDIKLQLDEFCLDVDVNPISGPVTGLFGPSGSGKTTVLEIVAGIRRPLSGFIQLDDIVLTDTNRKLHVPVERRKVGYVPQDLALFPHLNVEKNLLFGARHAGFLPAEYSRILGVLQIDNLLGRQIQSLSGGEKQRVAFARALLASPQLLLLDEPLASLDRRLKTKMMEYLQRVRDEFGIPMLYVSHDSDEINHLCDEIVVLEKGRARTSIHPKLLFHREDELPK